jgi:hypothetical protein
MRGSWKYKYTMRRPMKEPSENIPENITHPKNKSIFVSWP